MKKLVAFILTTLMCFPALSACSDKEVKTEDVLMGFESVGELLTVYTKNVGKLALCNDNDTVTQGENAMSVISKSVGETETAKDMYLSFVPGNAYYSKMKYTDVNYLSIDVYNRNDCDYEVAFINGEVSLDIFVIKPGKNSLQIYNDRETELYRNNGGITYLSLVFKGQVGKSSEFVVDNLKCYYTETESTTYAFDKTKEIWHTFEHRAETSLLSYQAATITPFTQPLFSINRDVKYILSGTGSLKVRFQEESDGKIGCTAFRTADNMMADLNNYVGAGKNYYLISDIYNDYNYAIDCQMTVFSNYANETFTKSFTIPAKSWSNGNLARIYLNDMLARFTGDGLDCMCISYYFGGIREAGNIYMDSIGIRQ